MRTTPSRLRFSHTSVQTLGELGLLSTFAGSRPLPSIWTLPETDLARHASAEPGVFRLVSSISSLASEEG